MSSFDLTPATEKDAEPGLHWILQAFKIFSAGKSFRELSQPFAGIGQKTVDRRRSKRKCSLRAFAAAVQFRTLDTRNWLKYLANVQTSGPIDA